MVLPAVGPFPTRTLAVGPAEELLTLITICRAWVLKYPPTAALLFTVHSVKCRPLEALQPSIPPSSKVNGGGVDGAAAVGVAAGGRLASVLPGVGDGSMGVGINPVV